MSLNSSEPALTQLGNKHVNIDIPISTAVIAPLSFESHVNGAGRSQTPLASVLLIVPQTPDEAQVCAAHGRMSNSRCSNSR